MKTYKSNIDEIRLKKVKSEFKKAKISSSKDAELYARQFFSDDLEIYESFFLILLNRSNNTIGYVKLSQGGCVGTLIDIKLILKYAVESLCQSIVLIHNHPSGNVQPSSQDKGITGKIQNALNLFDVSVIDHIILSSDAYYSFADEGIL